MSWDGVMFYVVFFLMAGFVIQRNKKVMDIINNFMILDFSQKMLLWLFGILIAIAIIIPHENKN